MKNCTEIDGDLTEQRNGVLCQQNNCVTSKAKGLALEFIRKFGLTADVYGPRKNRSTPGTICVRHIADNNTKMVAMFAQLYPGRPRYTADLASDRLRYFALCLEQLKSECDDDGVPDIYFPYKIGCGLAKGDWKTYQGMLNDFAGRYRGQVFIVRKM